MYPEGHRALGARSGGLYFLMGRNEFGMPRLSPASVASWPRAPIGRAFCAFRSSPVALYPATSDSEKISFNQINRSTGHRIKYLKVDADTGEEVASDEIMKGYKVDNDTYIEITKDELENIALDSTRTIEIDEFVPKADIDPRYLIRPYYLVPDGKVGHDAFAVIRETIRSMNKVAIGRVVLTSREHIIGLEPLKNGLMGTLLRYPYEVRSEDEYFNDIQDVKVTKDNSRGGTVMKTFLHLRWPTSWSIGHLAKLLQADQRGSRPIQLEPER
jgi:Ku protein